MTFNPLELHGSQSLAFAGGLMAVSAIASYAVRRYNLRGGAANPNGLDTADLAYLAQDPFNAFIATLIGLSERGVIRLESPPSLVTLLDRDAQGQNTLETTVLNAIRLQPTMFPDIEKACQPELHRMGRALRSRGLMWDLKQDYMNLVPGKLVAAIAPAYIAFKIYLGNSQGRPIGFLAIMLVFAVAIVALHFFTEGARLTLAGRRVVEAEQERLAIARSRGDRQLDRSVALNGSGVLEGTMLAGLMVLYATHHRTFFGGYNGCSPGHGCAGAGGDGGDGGGGCGGGGCGG